MPKMGAPYRPLSLKPLSEVQVAWLAGLLEGEGCFTEKRRRPFIVLGMTDEDVVRRCHEITGVGNVYVKKVPEGRKPQWIWQVQRFHDVVALMQLLLPHMGERRTTRIRSFLDMHFG